MARRLSALLLLFLCALSLADAQMKKRKMKNNKKQLGFVVMDLEKNISALWQEVDMLSQPVHVHIHGDGHLMDHYDHDNDSHDHDYHHDHHDYDHDHDSHDHDHDHDHRDWKHTMHGHDHEGKDHMHDHKDRKDEKHERMEHMHDLHNKDEMKKAKGCKNCTKGCPMMHGHGDHSHMHEGHDMHHGHYGTHVHIHLHTAMEEQMEMKHHHVPPPPQEYSYARCDVDGHEVEPFVTGAIFLRQMPGQLLEVQVNLREFTIDHEKENSNLHLRGMHVHEFGDMSDGCIRLGGHYNPHGVDHGGPGTEHRHPGDWGNLHLEEDGSVMTSFNDTDATIFGPESILGRGIVIHAGADDHGLGGDEGSKASGNAGARIACCAIVTCPEPEGIWSQ